LFLEASAHALRFDFVEPMQRKKRGDGAMSGRALVDVSWSSATKARKRFTVISDQGS
jgi:hypothetical protein